MTREEYEKICRAAYWGEEQRVENQALQETGIVFSCRADTFNVKIGRELRQWGRKICEESAQQETA